MSHPEAYAYRRRLPHWRTGNAIYFVTWRMAEDQCELSPGERTVVASALRHFAGVRYELFAYVVMNDHVHVLVRPLAGFELQSLVHTWKSYTTHRLQRQQVGRRGRLWQLEYFDRVVRDEVEFVEKATYILNNPWKRWPSVTTYQWVGSLEDAEEA